MAISTFQTVQSFVQFLWNWMLSGGQLVDQNTANLRAEICFRCHNNKAVGEIRQGCGVCNKMGNTVLNSVRSSIIKNNSTPYDSSLLACGICGCDLKISVWIPNHGLLKLEEADAYPSFCFKKKIKENLEV